MRRDSKPDEPSNVCVWCLRSHCNGLQLCDEHEALARSWRVAAGRPCVKVKQAGEEPSD